MGVFLIINEIWFLPNVKKAGIIDKNDFMSYRLRWQIFQRMFFVYLLLTVVNLSRIILCFLILTFNILGSLFMLEMYIFVSFQPWNFFFLNVSFGLRSTIFFNNRTTYQFLSKTSCDMRNCFFSLKLLFSMPFPPSWHR